MNAVIRPEFGNPDHIALLNYEKQFEGKKPIRYSECSGSCSSCDNPCDAELEECPYCGAESAEQFEDGECIDCGKEGVDWQEWNRYQTLLSKLKQPKDEAPNLQ